MICERCVQGDILEGEFTGKMEDGAYLAPAPGKGSLSANPSKTCVVILTDIFGLPLKNCKIMADSIAEKLGVDVWIPDQFAGSYHAQTEFLLPFRIPCAEYHCAGKPIVGVDELRLSS